MRKTKFDDIVIPKTFINVAKDHLLSFAYDDYDDYLVRFLTGGNGGAFLLRKFNKVDQVVIQVYESIYDRISTQITLVDPQFTPAYIAFGKKYSLEKYDKFPKNVIYFNFEVTDSSLDYVSGIGYYKFLHERKNKGLWIRGECDIHKLTRDNYHLFLKEN